MTRHPLTETAAAEMWDTHVGDTVPWDDWYGGSRRALTALLRAAFDAGQKYQDNLEDSTIRDIMQDVHRLRVERDDADNVVAALTADNLRDTPAGLKLMAEAWDQGVADNERGWEHVYAGHDIDPDDPLAICQTCGTPNPYREGNA